MGAGRNPKEPGRFGGHGGFNPRPAWEPGATARAKTLGGQPLYYYSART